MPKNKPEKSVSLKNVDESSQIKLRLRRISQLFSSILVSFIESIQLKADDSADPDRPGIVAIKSSSVLTGGQLACLLSTNQCGGSSRTF